MSDQELEEKKARLAGLNRVAMSGEPLSKRLLQEMYELKELIQKIQKVKEAKA